MPTQPASSRIEAPGPQLSAFDQAGGLLAILLSGGLLGLARWLRRRHPLWLALSLSSGLASATLLWLYRNPRRPAPSGHDLHPAPADGRILRLDQIDEPRLIVAYL